MTALAATDKPGVTPRWWGEDCEGERHEAIIKYVRVLEDEQHDIHQRFVDNAWLYHQSGMMGTDRRWHLPALARRNGPSATNIIESNIDALVALIARHKPRVAVVTDGGDFSMQQRSKWLDRWVEAEFKRAKVYADTTLMFRDAAVFGTGVLHVFADPDSGRPEVERVLIDDIVVDERECSTTAPRQIHRRKVVDVDRAIALFAKGNSAEAKKKARLLREAASDGSFAWTWYRQIPEHHVVIVESWHLPSGPGANDGRHCITAKGVTLRDEAYTEQDFPFIFYHWTPPLTGFYGRGIADILKPLQARMNRIRRYMTTALDRNARGRMFVHRNDAHLVDQIDNSDSPIHVVNSSAGVKDYKFQTGEGLSAETYADYERQKQEASLVSGASPETVSGGPIGADMSGAAYRQVSERENGRFSNQSERLEAVYVEIGDRLIRVQKKLAAKGGKDRKVMWNDGNLMRRIPWSKVEPENDEYVMSLKPASNLSRSLAGRIQEVIELAQANALTREQMLKLLDHPDLQEELDLVTASIRATDLVIEMLDDPAEDFPTPDPLLVADPATVDRVHAKYLVNFCLRAPEDVMQRYRDWLALAQDVTGEAAPPAPGIAADPMAAAAAGLTPGPGAAPGPGVPIPGMPVAAPPQMAA